MTDRFKIKALEVTDYNNNDGLQMSRIRWHIEQSLKAEHNMTIEQVLILLKKQPSMPSSWYIKNIEKMKV